MFLQTRCLLPKLAAWQRFPNILLNACYWVLWTLRNTEDVFAQAALQSKCSEHNAGSWLCCWTAARHTRRCPAEATVSASTSSISLMNQADFSLVTATIPGQTRGSPVLLLQRWVRALNPAQSWSPSMCHVPQRPGCAWCSPPCPWLLLWVSQNQRKGPAQNVIWTSSEFGHYSPTWHWSWLQNFCHPGA